jgi:hypothetical protein
LPAPNAKINVLIVDWHKCYTREYRDQTDV